MMSDETTTMSDAQGGLRQAMRDKEAGLGEGRPKGRRKRKVSYLTINKIEKVDYKEVNILRRFLNEHGRILPSRQTGNTAKQQRMIAQAIRRARECALLPFVVTDPPADRPDRGPRPPRNRDYSPRDNN